MKEDKNRRNENQNDGKENDEEEKRCVGDEKNRVTKRMCRSLQERKNIARVLM